MSLEIPSLNSESPKIEKRELPETVYYNFPVRYALMLPTIVDKFADLKSNAESEPNKDEFCLVMKNNSAWKVFPKIENSELVEKLKFFIPPAAYLMLSQKNKDELNQMHRKDLVNFLQIMREDNVQMEFEHELSRLLSQEGKSEPNDYDAAMEIQGAFYKGRFIPFGDFSRIKAEIEKDFEKFGMLSHVKEGDFLYRAVDSSEFNEILKDNHFLVRDNTNFEDHVGPQIEEYSKTKGYSGKIIRFKVAGPYYKDAGMAVKRVTSIVPHFVEIEIKEEEEWLSVEDYKRRFQENVF